MSSPQADARALQATMAAAAAQLHVPGPGPYLQTHAVGCQPRSARAHAEAAFFAPWASGGADALEAWLAQIDRFRAGLAGVLGGAPAQWCPQPNVSAGLAKLLSALPRRDARGIWVAAEDSFPSLGFVLERAAPLGIELRLIPRGRDVRDEATWAEALGSEVCGALVMHVHSNTGAVAPLDFIVQRCGELGARVVLDVAQSAGILPLDVTRLGADVVLGSCVKWLGGGPGAGFMWLRPDLLPTLEPCDVGWFSHEEPFEMDIRSFRYAPDARRFWGGTPSILPYVVASAGIEWIASVGVETLLAHNRTLIEAFLAAAPPAVRRSVDLERNGGTLCLDAGDALAAIRAALDALGVRYDVRGRAVRLSFHACNTLEQARRVGAAWPC